MATSEMTDRIPLLVPQMGVVEEIVVIEWLVQNGDQVTAGQNLVTVETEKAETQLEAPASGTIDIVVPASDNEIPVGTTLAYISP